MRQGKNITIEEKEVKEFPNSIEYKGKIFSS